MTGLSSGYRNNNPPESYYSKNFTIVPTEQRIASNSFPDETYEVTIVNQLVSTVWLRYYGKGRKIGHVQYSIKKKKKVQEEVNNNNNNIVNNW